MDLFLSVRGYVIWINTQKVWVWESPRMKEILDVIDDLRAELNVTRIEIGHQTVAFIGALRKSRIASHDMIRQLCRVFYATVMEEARDNI